MTTQVPQFGNVHIRFRRAKHFDASFTASFGAFEILGTDLTGATSDWLETRCSRQTSIQREPVREWLVWWRESRY
jgi:hypothetical protein